MFLHIHHSRASSGKFSPHYARFVINSISSIVCLLAAAHYFQYIIIIVGTVCTHRICGHSGTCSTQIPLHAHEFNLQMTVDALDC